MNSYKHALKWYLAKKTPKENRDVSQTRDVFQGRLDNFYGELSAKSWSSDQLSSLTAVLGEIGNNAFDHNLGQWRDIPGCLFGYEFEKKIILAWIADRGRGFFDSLKKVAKEISTDQQAIEMAYEKVISGRAPERRGNGLKFVRQVINGHRNRALTAISGKGKLSIGGLKTPIFADHLQAQAKGVFTIIEWRFE